MSDKPYLSIVHDDMLDITDPKGFVQVVLRDDRTVLWVNVDGICRLRICRISHGIEFHLPEGAVIHEGNN
jgi:hypothetical protein